MGYSQVWVTGSLGGDLYSPKLSKQLREQASPEYKFRQFVDIKEAFGAGEGSTVEFPKRLRIDTKGGTLTETDTMPENKWKIIKGSAVVAEWGNAVPWTHKLETLSEFNPENISHASLKEDMVEVLDSAAYAQFITAEFTAVAVKTDTTSFSTTTTPAATSTAKCSDKNWRDIIDYMDDKQIPTYPDGDYRSIISINTNRGVYDFLEGIMQYTTPEFTYKGEVGRYYGCRAVKENALLLNTGYGKGVFFGREAVVEIIAELEHMVMKTPTDYGRSKGISWQAMLQYAKMWSLAADDLNSTGKGVERIVYLTTL